MSNQQLLRDWQDLAIHLAHLGAVLLLASSVAWLLICVLRMVYNAVGKVMFLLKCRRMFETIPGVKGGVPLFGQAFNLIATSPWDVMTQWVHEYGPVYWFNLFGSICVTIADPDLLKEVMRTKMTSFNKDVDFTYRPFLSLLGTGIVSSDGAEWRRQRNLVSSAFRIEVLELIPAMALRATERFCKKLEAVKGTGQTVEIAEEFRHLTMQVITEALMSLTPEQSDRNFATKYMPIVVEGHKRTWDPFREYLFFTPAFWRHQMYVRSLNRYISGVITRRWELLKTEPKTSKRPRDILDRVLAAVPPGGWGPAVVRQVRDELKTFVLAGHETSASMMSWALYQLTLNPGCMAKALAEADQLYGSTYGLGKSLPPPAALAGLRYTNMCLQETLRLYSVVPTVVRSAGEDTVITAKDGTAHYIPRGTKIMLLIQGVHSRSDLWPTPSKFDPDRFCQDPAPYTFVPFIDGPRVCLGQYLSLLESKVVLSLLLHKYRFVVTNENGGDRHPWMIPVIPHHGTHVRIESRAAAKSL